jgi:predicted transcriptional regulator
LKNNRAFKVMSSETEVLEDDPQDVLRWSADIVAAYVAQNSLPPTGVAPLISSVHQALAGLGAAPEPPPEKRKPAAPISRSVQHDYIICLEDGKKLKMLKRYLRSRYDLSPEEYRRKWGLAPDYPMVAPAYAERRSNFAKKIGLGRGVRRRKA